MSQRRNMPETNAQQPNTSTTNNAITSFNGHNISAHRMCRIFRSSFPTIDDNRYYALNKKESIVTASTTTNKSLEKRNVAAYNGRIYGTQKAYTEPHFPTTRRTVRSANKSPPTASAHYMYFAGVLLLRWHSPCADCSLSSSSMATYTKKRRRQRRLSRHTIIIMVL